MSLEIDLGKLRIEVVYKPIKNLHLSVNPPDGRVRITAPERLPLERIKLFAISKLDWIRRRRAKIQGQARDSEPGYVERESHFVWGKRYLLEIVEAGGPPRIELTHRAMKLHVRADANEARRNDIVESWYRELVRAEASLCLQKWEERLGTRMNRLFVQRMKTRWGSCNPVSRNIRLNTDLAKKPKECLEYLVVHELIHLIEPSHNERFIALMDRHLPTWRGSRALLNRLPLRQENWEY
jgi:predicted metal-dependent hydrolase